MATQTEESMQITEKGKQVVASLEFAHELRRFLAERHAAGVTDELGIAAAVSLIAWVLTGHEINRPPKTDDDLTALAMFCDSHVAEIEATGGVILTRLCEIDCGPIVH
jgi:hypothetical protein